MKKILASCILLTALVSQVLGETPSLWQNDGTTKIKPVGSKIILTNKQLESTIATGTAPFTVTSTTKSANLHADEVDFVSFAGPTQARVITVNDAAMDLSTTGSPVFAGLTVDANSLFVDAANNFIGLGTTSPAAKLHVVGALSKTAWGVNGIVSRYAAATYTDTDSTGTVTSAVAHSIGQPTFASSSATTYTNAATFYVAGPVAAGSNVTLTNNYGFWVNSGQTRFNGNVLQAIAAAGTGATFNIVLGGGSGTPVLGAATTDAVHLAAVDKAAGDRRLYIQPEAGDVISLGNDRINFAATTGRLSIGGTDAVAFTSDTTTLNKASVKAGTSSDVARVGGSLSDFYTDTSVGGAEADIYSTSLLANTYGSDGDKVTAVYAGNFVTGGTELTQLKVYLAGTAIWDSTGVAPTTGTTSWDIRVDTVRGSSTSVRYTVVLGTTGASGYVYAKSGELAALTLTNANTLKITGTSTGVGSGVGDIVGKMGYVEWKPAH